ncbi:DUF2793 domain-containing protein [Parasphingorhabdus sp. JC815]|uniref:DUF2793 domain-containing protein n=1 Tax=Parasphingorhabdus sp. JC815 TaxID=3232140 RepID=UPI00345A2B0E
MTTLETSRFGLPLLAVGQAHKELFHNDALLLLDFLINPVVKAVTNDPDILQPVEGDCWLVGTAPVSGWSGKAGRIAGWSGGGWHFIKPQESMRIIISGSNSPAIYRNAVWHFPSQIDAPTGGTTIDPEARLAIDSILDLLRRAGILPQII